MAAEIGPSFEPVSIEQNQESSEANRSLLDRSLIEGDEQFESTLRPQKFEDFPGQHRVKDKLSVFVQAATRRKEPLDHILLCGPPGLGKTTLAHIIARAMGVECKTTSGPALDRKGEIAAILTGLTPGCVLFIDEIHRLNRSIEEYLYSAMEDFYIDILTGEGLGARSIQFQLAPFTLIGATTRAGLVNSPMRDRFGIVERLEFYQPKDLQLILQRSSRVLGIEMDPEGAFEIARRCRGTPRIANRLLRRVRDFAQVRGNGVIDVKTAQHALELLDVDALGLDDMDRKILRLMIEKFAGGPVGIETLSAALSEEPDTLEDVYEPYLLQEGFLQKTPRGRVVTERARQHLGLVVK